MILHVASGSPHSCALRIVATEKGIEVEERPVDLAAGDQFDPAFLALDGHGQVPLVEHEGRVMGETFPLLLYLDALGQGPSLAGSTPRSRYHVHKWGKYVETHIAPHLATVRWDRLGKPVSGPPEVALGRLTRPRADLWRRALAGFPAEQVQASRGVLDGAARRLAADLADRDWLAQDDFTLADAAVYPHLAQFPEMDVPLPEAVAAWLDRVAARPSARALAKDMFALPTMGPEAGRWG